MLPGGTNDDEQTMEDRATQPLGCWKAEFRNYKYQFINNSMFQRNKLEKMGDVIGISKSKTPTYSQTHSLGTVRGRWTKKNRKKTDKCQFSMYVCRPEK